MAFEAKILADSINPRGQRLTTMQLTYPRCIHAEFMTHRMFSRNSASSRAIPFEKMIENILADPFVPIEWGKNQKGMSAREVFPPDSAVALAARSAWIECMKSTVRRAKVLHEMGLHKQIVNRLVEPWMWITVIASATCWDNFFKLRCHPDAEPHIQKIAYMARDLRSAAIPQEIKWGDWHLPLTGFDGDEGLLLNDLVKVSTARCARVSYLTHDGVRDVDADIKLHDRLSSNGHWSPFEHAAVAQEDVVFSGNYVNGWKQYRKLFAGETANILPLKTSQQEMAESIMRRLIEKPEIMDEIRDRLENDEIVD